MGWIQNNLFILCFVLPYVSGGIESKLLVFGGYNQNNYVNSNIFSLELSKFNFNGSFYFTYIFKGQKKAKNLMKENKQKTMMINRVAEAEGKGPVEPESQIELDEIAGEPLSSGLRRSIKVPSRYSNLAFSNFRSFMPLPRNDFWEKKK